MVLRPDKRLILLRRQRGFILNPFVFGSGGGGGDAGPSTLLNGLVGYWNLNSDSKGFGSPSIDGTDTSITYNSGNGKVGNGAGFNGTSSKITFGNVLDEIGTAAFTLACWFKTTGSGTAVRPLITKQSITTPFPGYNLSLNGITASAPDAGKMSLTLGQITSVGLIGKETNSAYNDGNWHLGLCTYDGSKTRAGIALYIDGAAAASTDKHSASFTNSITTTAPFQIGCRDTNQFATDSIDECGKWNRVLTGAEITELYNGGTGKTFPFS